MSQITRIISLFFKYNIPENLKKRFHEWLAYPHNESEKDSGLQQIWDSIELKADQFTEKSFAQVTRRLGIAGSDNKKLIHFEALSKVVAVLLLPVISFGMAYLYFSTQAKQQSDNTELVDCFVPYGQSATLVLPDSSKVNINAGSILIYPRTFNGSSRTVYLNGEACFSVKQDKTKVFIVQTSDFSVEALGTVFNVSSYMNSELALTGLESGSIAVQFIKDTIPTMVLLPGEQISYNRTTGSIEKKLTEMEDMLAWTQGHLVFKSQLLSDITKQLERHYGVSIYIGDIKKYEKHRITAKFKHNENLDDLLTALQQLVPDCRYRREGNNIVFF